MNLLSDKQIDQLILHNIIRKHSKSGGHGGQNVNKRETKAEGYFDVSKAPYLDADQKTRLMSKYHNHISKKDVLRLTCSEQRNYHQNHSILKKHFKVLFENLGKEILFDVLHHKHHRKH